MGLTFFFFFLINCIFIFYFILLLLLFVFTFTFFFFSLTRVLKPRKFVHDKLVLEQSGYRFCKLFLRIGSHTFCDSAQQHPSLRPSMELTIFSSLWYVVRPIRTWCLSWVTWYLWLRLRMLNSERLLYMSILDPSHCALIQWWGWKGSRDSILALRRQRCDTLECVTSNP